LQSILKASNARIKVKWIETSSIEVAVYRQREEMSAKWSGVQEEKKRTKNRTSGNATGAAMRKRIVTFNTKTAIRLRPTVHQSINQSINQFISSHTTEFTKPK